MGSVFREWQELRSEALARVGWGRGLAADFVEVLVFEQATIKLK